jgi:hypothetical protein
MKYLPKVIEAEIDGVVGGHITPHGAGIMVTMTEEGVLVTVTTGTWSSSRFIRLAGLPANIQSEVTHCAVHALALTLLGHLYPRPE